MTCIELLLVKGSSIQQKVRLSVNGGFHHTFPMLNQYHTMFPGNNITTVNTMTFKMLALIRLYSIVCP
jgi:hypothetical protein